MDSLFNYDEAEEKILTRSKRKWIWRGIFGWGLSMFIGMELLDHRFRLRPISFDRAGLSGVFVGLVFWLTAGYFWSLGMSKWFPEGPRR